MVGSGWGAIRWVRVGCNKVGQGAIRWGAIRWGALCSNSCYVYTETKTESKPEPDPVNEICTNFPVKIADLGNACWIVSTLQAMATQGLCCPPLTNS